MLSDKSEGPARGFQWPAGIKVAVSFSFDDSRPSQIDRGVPILNRYGLHGTFYVVPRSLEPDRQRWTEAAGRGHELGNHTVSHPCAGNFPWSREHALELMTLDDMEAELTGASKSIERLTGVQPRTFAYCCGQKYVGRGEEVKSTVPLVARLFRAGRGFRDESTNDPAFCDLAQIAGIDGDGLSGEEYLAWVSQGADRGGWVVFAGHDVGDGGRQTVRAESLEALCGYSSQVENGVWFETVEKIADYIVEERSRQGPGR